MVSVDLDALARDSEALLTRLEAAVYRGLDAAAQAHAQEARANHWYRNRTGDLEASTRAFDAEGRVWDDDASAVVAATESYAPYVDARGSLLEPAWSAVESTATAELVSILEQASS